MVNNSDKNLIKKPDQPLLISPELRRSIGDRNNYNSVEDFESANLASTSPQAKLGKAPNPDLFVTQEKIRDFESVGPGMYTKNTIESDLIITSSQGHSTEVNGINKQMQLPLDTISFKTSQIRDNAETAAGQRTKNLNKVRMNFETTRKDIFESSGVVKIQREVTPLEVANDLTATMMQTQLTSTDIQTRGDYMDKQTISRNTKSFCSLFVIFGLNASIFAKNNLKEVYEVLGSYPNLKNNPSVAAEHKFVQDLRMICFPEVELKAERFHLSRSDPICRCSFFHFITTNDLGEKQYLTSVHFKEILLCEKGAFMIPKAVCVASSQPIFSLQKQVLNQIFEKVVLKNNTVSIQAFKEAQRTYEGFLDEYEQPPGHDFPNFVYKFMMDTIMCAENRRANDRSSPTRSPSRLLKLGENSQSLPVVDFTPILELYVSVFSKHLYFDPTVDRDIQIILTDISSSQHMFGGGKNAEAMNIKNSKDQEQAKTNKHVPLFKFRNLKPFGFQLENYPFDLLLQKIKPEKLIQLFTALLLERKIVLIKNEIGEIALVMQSLITLLNPFQWCFTIITYLNRELVDMLDAPFPFIIGVSTSTWEDICTLKDYPEEIYVFDLEAQERRFISKFEIPELPQPYGDQLLAGLKDVMEKKDRRLEALREENKQSKSKSKIPQQRLDKQFEEQYWADAQLSVKQLFFNFLLETVGNYVQYYRTSEEQEALNEEALGKNKVLNDLKTSDDFFDFDRYLESREAKFPGNFFMREFIKTQTFHEFIEQQYGDRIEKEGAAENASMFFDSCVELMQEHGMPKLRAAQQEMIDQAKYNLATPVKFKFNGIYSKYVEGLRSREKHLRQSQEEAGNYNQRKFTQMGEADQIDEVIMKYIFMRPETPEGGFIQYSLINEVNQFLVYEDIPRIRYDLVELYWQKMYKAKTRPETTKVEKEKELTSLKKHKRVPNKNELEYDQYIKGNQAQSKNLLTKSGSRQATPSYVNQGSHQFSTQSGLKMMSDSVNFINQSSLEYFHQQKQDRQSQSTRNLVSDTDQKSKRLAYKKHAFAANKDQLRIGKTKTAHKQRDFFYEFSNSAMQSRSPKSLLKSATLSTARRIPKVARNQVPSNSSGAPIMSSINTTRNKSHTIIKTSSIQVKTLTLTGKGGIKPSNFQEKVKVARQRGSIQNLPAFLTTEKQIESQRTSDLHDLQIIEHSDALPGEEISANIYNEENVPLRQKQIPVETTGLALERTSTRSNKPQMKIASSMLNRNKLTDSMQRLQMISMQVNEEEPSAPYQLSHIIGPKSQEKINRLKSYSGLNAKLKNYQDQNNFSQSGKQESVNVPIYTEKKAVPQPGLIRSATTTVSNIRISCEFGTSKNSFINIVKQEDQSLVVGEGKTVEEQQRGEPEVQNYIELSPSVAEDETKLYNSTENLRDGLNEYVDDQASIIQTTDFYLQYRSKLNPTQNKDIATGTRQQMMPSQPGMELNRQLSTPNHFSKESDQSSQSHFNPNLTSESSNEAKSNSLPQNPGSSEKQSLRKGAALPLSMLLQKTKSQTKRDSGSKTGSNTEKQQSFLARTRLPSKSQVSLMGMRGVNPIAKIPSQLPEEEHKDLTEGSDEEGWFTAHESKNLSKRFQQPVSSQETQKKLKELYSDIEGTLIQHQTLSLRVALQPASQAEHMQHARQQLIETYPVLRGADDDSPQQSSRISQENQKTIRKSGPTFPSANATSSELVTEEQKLLVDKSRAEPNNGILFSHQKRRTEKYRNYF